MFLFWFSGSFLFRFAERRFLGSFKKEPPRSTSADATDMVRIGRRIRSMCPVDNFGQKKADGCQELLQRSQAASPTSELTTDAIDRFQGVEHLLLVQEVGGSGHPKLHT